MQNHKAAFDAFAQIDPNWLVLDDEDGRQGEVIQNARQFNRSNYGIARALSLSYSLIELAQDPQASEARLAELKLAESRRPQPEKVEFDESFNSRVEVFVNACAARENAYDELFQAFHVESSSDPVAPIRDMSPQKAQVIDDIRDEASRIQADNDTAEAEVARCKPLSAAIQAMRERNQRLQLRAPKTDLRELYEALQCSGEPEALVEE